VSIFFNTEMLLLVKYLSSTLTARFKGKEINHRPMAH
jgi:hypothetical protein